MQGRRTAPVASAFIRARGAAPAGDGKSNAELAAHLLLVEGTMKTCVSHVLSKLGLRDGVQAVVFAYESGLVA